MNKLGVSTLKIAWYFLSFQSTTIFQAQDHIEHFNGLLLGGPREKPFASRSPAIVESQPRNRNVGVGYGARYNLHL